MDRHGAFVRGKAPPEPALAPSRQLLQCVKDALLSCAARKAHFSNTLGLGAGVRRDSERTTVVVGSNVAVEMRAGWMSSNGFTCVVVLL